MKPNVYTIDLDFQGISNTIGVFLIPHARGGILIECGPGSTIPALITGIKSHGLSPQDITDVLVTHIHLDHAGSSGWWAQQGAAVHVHEVGAPHLLNPEKLIASASRIYGDRMDQLWGGFLPTPKEKLNILQDGDEIKIEELVLQALDTPGHASHHMTYLMDGICFSGDCGGIRVPGIKALRLPTVAPEFHIDKWRGSVQRLRGENIQIFAATHFGLHEDAAWHLDAIERTLDDMEIWAAEKMKSNPPKDVFREQFSSWIHERDIQAGVSSKMIAVYDAAISSEMSADGIWRYWNKFRDA